MAIKDDEFLKAFGQHLQQIRKGNNISLRVLEQLSEVDYSQIHRIENGKSSPSLGTLRKLANALEITLAELLTFDY